VREQMVLLRDARGSFAKDENAVRRVRADGRPVYDQPIPVTFREDYERRHVMFKLPKKIAARGWRIGRVLLSPSQSKVQLTIYRQGQMRMTQTVWSRLNWRGV